VLGGHLEDHDACAGGNDADVFGGALECHHGLFRRELCGDALGSECIAKRVRLWCSHPHARLCPISQIGQRGLNDESTLCNDDDVVDGLGDLGQKMARYEHTASLVGIKA
jgi:hypothetical protein